jgi:hypothetical protein
MHLTSLVYLDVKLHVGGFLGACANKTYLLFGPPGITPDAGMLRSGVYNKLTSKVFNSSNQYVN